MYTIASKVLGVDRARRGPAFSAISSRVLSDWRCLSEDQPGFLKSRSRRRQPSSQRRREPACANRPPCERLFSRKRGGPWVLGRNGSLRGRGRCNIVPHISHLTGRSVLAFERGQWDPRSLRSQGEIVSSRMAAIRSRSDCAYLKLRSLTWSLTVRSEMNLDSYSPPF